MGVAFSIALNYYTSANWGESPEEPFHFANLPAEIRNQVYRCILIQRTQPVKIVKSQRGPTINDLAIIFINRLIYSEAMPIFLCGNAFSITGRRKEHTWLRRMRPEGRSELRNITLEVSEYGCKHDFSVYNALSMCPRVHLTLKVRPSRLAEAALEGDLRNMHGFAGVTSDALPKEANLCSIHQRTGLAGWEVTLKRDRRRHFELLLQQFQAPCVGKCRVHKGREGTHTQATIHISFDEACYYCC
ncbi:MAG: hypothetical protein ALECFALPRED_006590 [Alectoria fallacina]|uniref:Uncharacterized protein n=1 Tax=Alectoria fallacina TaxID=1903189 RepID=A0A8H3ERP0_9LECA|nr:MAG: hypothetical protein ALECFALPRED_006590 [Alectoria fallacina]